jgi:hypothetical protein
VLIAWSPAKRAASAAEVSRIRPPQNHLGLALMAAAIIRFTSPETASLSSRNIAAAIAAAQDKHAERAELTADCLIDDLRKIAGANMADYLKSTTHGDPYRDFSALTRDPDRRGLMSAARA